MNQFFNIENSEDFYMDFIYEGCLLVIGNKLFDDKVFEFINNFPKLNSK
jgi:hypothetical protein